MYKFKRNGYEKIGNIFNSKDCSKLLNEIYKSRNFKKIFLTKSQFKKKINSKKVNPRPGYNLLEKMNTKFIFDNLRLDKRLCSVLGKKYRILDYKLVMGFPKKFIPKWILREIEGKHANNLGKFINPKYRDITYFMGIDFHQDIIDFPGREPNFVTVYIYIDKVSKNCSPLHVVPNTHLGGGTSFPHKLSISGKRFIYNYSKKKTIKSNVELLLGKPGSAFFWHPFILHGTQPQDSDYPRISVRMLVEKGYGDKCKNLEIDIINKKIRENILNQKKLSVSKVRNIKDKISKKNLINRI